MLDTIHQAVLKFQREYKSDQKSNQKSDQKIYALMEQDPTITIQELMLRLHMGESGIKKQIAKLKKAGRIIRVGGAKGGRWEVWR